jgi:hypothetical protein
VNVTCVGVLLRRCYLLICGCASDKPVAAGLDQSLRVRETSDFSGAALSNLVGGVELLLCYVVLCQHKSIRSHCWR